MTLFALGSIHMQAAWRRLLSLALMTATLLILASNLSAVQAWPATPSLVTFTVNSVLDQVDTDTADGLCLTASGTCTLRAAIMQANTISGEGAEVILPAGTYTLTRPAVGDNGPDSGDLNLIPPANGDPVIHIAGSGAEVTFIDANGLDRAFRVHESRKATISRLTIENGYIENLTGPTEGGAISNIGTLEVADCVIRDNVSSGKTAEGGGISNGGRLVVIESTIHDNTAEGETASGGGLYSFGYLEVVQSTIENNKTSGDIYYGGGIMSDGVDSILTVTMSTIRNNIGIYGGGIYSALGYLRVSESTISDNTASVGGGIYLNFGAADVIESRIIKNTAPSAGGVYNSDAMDVVRTEISGNRSDGPFAKGGGIINTEEGFLKIIESTVSENATRTAGGIYNAGSLFMINSTVSVNDAYDSAGGIYNDGTANVYNTTIVFNQADADIDFTGEASGVFSRAGAAFNLRNTLLAGNYRSGAPEYTECGGFINSYGRNLIGVATFDGDSVSCEVDESFGPWDLLNSLDAIDELQNNGGPTPTHALLLGSNAIDGGDPDNGCVDQNSVLLTTDQRGAPRVAGERCDIGAFEYGALESLPKLFLPMILR